MKRSKEIPRWRGALAAGLGVAALVAALHAGGILAPLEYATRDLRMRLTIPERGGHPDVVLVYYSEDSLALMREKWNVDWRHRSLVAGLFKGISGKPSDQAKGRSPGAPPPSMALFDFFTLCDPSEFHDDLIQEIRSAPWLFLAAPFAFEKRRFVYAPETFLRKFSIEVENDGSVAPPAYRSVVLPVEAVSRAAHGICDVHGHPDPDGTDRRYHLLGRYRGRLYASPALAAILRREGVRTVAIRERVLTAGKVTIPIDAEGAIHLRYYRPSGGTYRAYEAYHTINNRSRFDETGEWPHREGDRFSGKTVIIAASAPGLFDLRVTPVADAMTGGEVHAVAIANLLNRDYLRPTAPWVSYALMGALILVAAGATRFTSAASGAIATVGLLAGYAFASYLLFRSRWIVDVAPQTLGILLGYAATSAVNYVTEGRQKLRVKRTFQKYLSAQVVEKILENPEDLRLEGERKVLTVFFLDLAGFTALSERLDPVEVVRLTNRYNEAIVEEIWRTEGTLDKFIGDAVMAFWGDPIEQPDHALRACRTAVAIREKLRAMPEARARIGLNTGLVIVGNMGSRVQHNYTVMGNDVNLASRLEGVNKEFGTDIIVSASTYAAACESVEARELALVQVVGKTHPVRIFELLGEKGRVDGEIVRRARRFEEGLALFRNREWAQAGEVFSELRDTPSRLYLRLCEECASSPPPENWEGLYIMQHK